MADNWLSDVWEWFIPGEDDKGIFKNIFGSDETEYEDISSFDDSLLDDLGYDPNTGSVDDWLQSILPTEEMDWNNFIDWGDKDPAYSIDVDWLDKMPETDTGIFGGQIGPLLRNLFLGSGDTGSTGGNRQDGGLLGGGGLGTLASLWALNKARKEGDDPGAVIPMGQQAFGMDDVYGGPTQDYRVFNLQPALLPGVAYANAPPPTPPGMKGGGLGDITLARLEPGEFVMTKKATDNIGARNLYKMMKQAEGMG